MLVLYFLISSPLRAQLVGASLSVAAGQSTGIRTDSAGLYGNAAAAAMQRAVARAMIAALSPWVFIAGTEPAYWENVAFSPDQAQGNPQGQPKPPESQSGAPSLGDLGFPPDQTQGNLQDQARLDKRSHMLKMHQRLGLITTVPLLATVISGSFAGGKETGSTGRDLHAALGSVTTGLYFTTAYYAIFAPKVPGIHNPRADPPAQSSGVDSWPGNDPDTHLWG